MTAELFGAKVGVNQTIDYLLNLRQVREIHFIEWWAENLQFSYFDSRFIIKPLVKQPASKRLVNDQRKGSRLTLN